MSACATAPHERRPPSSYKCLVLNADYRPLSSWPLSLVPAQEAISTLWRDRADVVETWEGAFFRSPNREVAVPKVIALRSYANVHAKPKFCRRSILLRDRFRCQYCGEQFPAEDLTYDHVVPRSAGGRTEWENILTACVDCNSAKKNAMPNFSGRKGDARRPLKAPRQPTAAELMRAGLEFLDPVVKEDWGSYLYWSTELQP